MSSPATKPPSTWRKVILGTAPIRFREMEWRRTIVVASVVGSLTALSIWFGEPEAAFPLAVGSLFTGLSGISEAPEHRWRIMLWTGLWVGLASILGGLMSNLGVAELAVVAVVGAGCGFAGALGRRGALVGVLTLVTYAIYAGIPDTGSGTFESGALIGLGAMIQMAALLIPVLVPLVLLLWMGWLKRASTGIRPAVTRAKFRRRNRLLVIGLMLLLAFGIIRNFVPYLDSGSVLG